MLIVNSQRPGVSGCVVAGRTDRHLCQPKVENLGVAAFGYEDVGWLDVAVDDAFAVRGIQRICNFDAQINKAVNLERAAQYRFS